MPHPLLELLRVLAPILLIVPVALRGAERRLLRRLRGDRATTEEMAVRLGPAGPLEGWQLGRLRRAGAVRTRARGADSGAPGPLLWLDEIALERFQQARRRRALLMAAAAAGLILLLLARTGGSHPRAVTPAAGRLPERDARVLVPEGMPLSVEDGIFAEDASLFSFSARNPSRHAALFRARVFVFEAGGRLRGSTAYAPTDVAQPGTRQRVTFVLEVKGVSARDRFVLMLEEVGSAESTWRAAGSLVHRIELARRTLDAAGAVSRSVVEAGSGELPHPHCTCEAAEALGIEGCGVAALAAYTCTPIYPSGCSQGFTCTP